MSEGNLDDLIIPDNEPETGSSPKSKSIVVLLALIVLLIIVGAVLAKMIFSSSTRDVNESKNQAAVSNTQKNSVISSEIPPIEQSKSNSNKAGSDDLDKNMQVPDADLAPIKNDTLSLKNTKTVSIDDNKDINNNSNINTENEETNIKNQKKDIPREELVVKDDDNGPVSDNKKIHKKPSVKHKVYTKHKHNKTVHSYGGKVYIQVGSFRKGPTEDFIDKIRRAGFKYRIKTANGYRRVFVGPFRSREEAKQYLGKVRSQISANAFIK